MQRALEPLPLGAIRPAGWLSNQLRIQASGLSGHLDEFWKDVAESGWIGGDGEGWERGPYWLDGVVPLAFVLDDERLKAKVGRWVDYIVEHQHADGWLGPVPKDGRRDVWPIVIVLKALTQYEEATGDPRILHSIERCLRRVREEPWSEWARFRGADLTLSVLWLHARTGEPWLLHVARAVVERTFDWAGLFVDYPHKTRVGIETLRAWQERHGGAWLNDELMASHGVNLAMAIKAPAIACLVTDDPRAREKVDRMLATLDRYHGQVTGVFTCDEHVAGPNPSQGTELCTVVEYLFTLEQLVSVFGDTAYADRLERIAFNALPATFTKDMWAHQYDQQANQVVCRIDEDRVYTNNQADANIFGLEPNFGCCTANMHQGWPKLAAHLFMRTRDGGLAAVVYAPCRVTASGIRIAVTTDYPFSEVIDIDVEVDEPVRFPLLLRIPAWAEGATVDGGAARPGGFFRTERRWTGTTRVSLRLPMRTVVERRFHGSAAIVRGPLVYSLRVPERWKRVRGEPPHADWEAYPDGPWSYAIDLGSVRFEQGSAGTCPFSPEGAPTLVKARGRLVPGWVIEHNAAGPIPESPVRSDEPLEDLVLLPYGCTHLRVTEMPVLP